MSDSKSSRKPTHQQRIDEKLAGFNAWIKRHEHDGDGMPAVLGGCALDVPRPTTKEENSLIHDLLARESRNKSGGSLAANFCAELSPSAKNALRVLVSSPTGLRGLMFELFTKQADEV